MSSTPTPDPAVALSLLSRNYWIAPLVSHKKNPPRFGERTHGDLLADKDKSFLDAVVLQSQYTATGWVAILQASDPLPLCVVDVDAYGIPLEKAWSMLSTDPLPPGLGIVRSASSGWHFWFRLPDVVYANALGSTWDFGNGRKGEIRASRDVLQLIVLPGSIARNKQGELGRYESAGHPLTDLESLALMPETLLSRLANKGRKGADAPPRGGLATEAHHLLSVLNFVQEIPPGEQNGIVAKIGQIAGRIGPAEKPPPDLLSAAWDALRDRLPASDPAHPWTFTGFEKTFQSGYKSGRKSGVAHSPSPDFPSESDVLAECQSVFGWLPHLTKVYNQRGEFQEYLLGTADGKNIVSVKDHSFRDILADLCKLSPKMDYDAFVKSPLFLMASWKNVLRHWLMRESDEERMGNDPEALFWEMVNDWARGTAQDKKFLDTLSGPWKRLESKTWIVAPAKRDWIFCMHPDRVADLSRRMGDVRLCKQLMRNHFVPHHLPGGQAKQQTMAVQHLTTETQAHIREGYNAWVAQQHKQHPRIEVTNDAQ